VGWWWKFEVVLNAGVLHCVQDDNEKQATTNAKDAKVAKEERVY
jgi:hypothetical protein